MFFRITITDFLKLIGQSYELAIRIFGGSKRMIIVSGAHANPEAL
jgi:hypothetical protein|tara:strand:+ start:714 stop:848 length:135 start_codon:yes stop_codon:yes gene_type:complete